MAEVGEISDKEQKLLDKTNKPGNLKNAHLWIVRCMKIHDGERCDHIYGANGEDFGNVNARNALAARREYRSLSGQNLLVR